MVSRRYPSHRGRALGREDAYQDEPAGGLGEALHAARFAERRPPTDADAPPVKPFRGKKVKPLPGQLSLDAGEPR